MEGQERVEDRQSAIGGTEWLSGVTDRVEYLPFLDRCTFSYGFRGDLACHLAKRHRPPPKGRRCDMRLHFLSPIARQ